MRLIDPPEGWRYGFPKRCPDNVENINEWLVQNGYPMSKILEYGDVFFYRTIRTEPYLSVYETPEGEKYLVTEDPIKKGALIKSLRGQLTTVRTKHSIEVGPNQHVEDPAFSFMQHSFTPNCEVRNGDVYALQDINALDKLTSNYLDHESEIAFPFIDEATGQLITTNP